VTGWTRTSYSGVTTRGLSTSPSATQFAQIDMGFGGAHRNRTDQAICLQGKSGFLARTP